MLLYARGANIWRRYDCGMVEFLVRLIEGDFPTCPLSDISLFGRGSATFFTTTEYLRRLRAGLDPITGGPDPYAGMFDYGPRELKRPGLREARPHRCRSYSVTVKYGVYQPPTPARTRSTGTGLPRWKPCPKGTPQATRASR